MTRSASLPAGTEAVATASIHRARHAVYIGTTSPIRVCQGPGSLTIGGNTYTEAALSIGGISELSSPRLSVRLGNASNEVSEIDAAGDLLGCSLILYEVHWDATEAQLEPVVLFIGQVVASRYTREVAEITAAFRADTSAGRVGRIVSRLCAHTFRDARCGKGTLSDFLADPIFTRATVAYKQDGTSVTTGTPRYEAAKFSNGVTIEEATANGVTANQSSCETDTTGWASNADTGAVTGARITSDYKFGAACYRLTSTTGGNRHRVSSPASTAKMTAAASTVYTASAWVKFSGSTSRNLSIEFVWCNSGGAEIGTSASGNFVPTNGWQRIEFTATSIALTASLFVRWIVDVTTTNDTLMVDGVQVEQKAYRTSWHIGGGTRNAETLTLPEHGLNDAEGTIECWIKLLRSPGTTDQYILDGQGESNHNLLIGVGYTDGKLWVVYGTGSSTATLNGTTALVVDTLYHVAVTWKSTGVALYLNGASQDTDSTAPALVFGATPYLGSLVGTAFLDGIIDDLRIMDVAQTSTQVDDDYDSASALACTDDTRYKAALDSDLSHDEGACVGAWATCDRTMVSCTAYANITRYGGWPSMPQIGQKFSYTLTVPQAGGARAGDSTAYNYDPPAPDKVSDIPPRRVLKRAT